MITPDQMRMYADYGVATVYEASGRLGLVDVPLIQVIPGSRAAGRALTVQCGQDDNLMVHAVMERIQPGDVLVLTMPQPSPVALIGELLATQALVRQAAAILVDGAVRDTEDLRQMGLPIWTRFVSVRGATKSAVGSIGEPVTVGTCRIKQGDILVLDSDGAVCVGAERAEAVLDAARARVEKETKLREQLKRGALSYDLHGLRAVVEKGIGG